MLLSAMGIRSTRPSTNMYARANRQFRPDRTGVECFRRIDKSNSTTESQVSMTNAERVSIAASLVAIIVSLVTAYFQFFWRNDDFRVQWYFEHAGVPSLEFVPRDEPSGTASIRIDMSPTFVFLNAGNQNVTLKNVSVLLLQNRDAPVANIWRHGENPPLSTCYDTALGGAEASWQRFTFEGEVKDARPIVIDAGKSVPVRVWFRQLDETVDHSWRADSEVTTCFVFNFIDSRGRDYTKRVPAQRFGSSGGAGEEREDSVDLL